MERKYSEAVAELPPSTLVELIDMNKCRSDLVRQQVLGQYYIYMEHVLRLLKFYTTLALVKAQLSRMVD